MPHNQQSTLEAEIAQLEDLDLHDLRRTLGRLLGAVPANHSKHLLRRRLAYELQARMQGDLPAAARRRLRNLHQSFKADSTYRLVPGIGLKPGTILTRTWQGATHLVHVTGDGFDYCGEHFGSLSQVARRITGTRWSGPVFFGFKGKKES